LWRKKEKERKKRVVQPSVHLCTDNPLYFIAIIVINATQVKVFSKTLFKQTNSEVNNDRKGFQQLKMMAEIWFPAGTLAALP